MTRFGGGFAGVFRVDDTQRAMRLHVGRSADGIEWRLDGDRVTIYYGAADTVVCLAYGYLSELLAFVRRG